MRGILAWFGSFHSLSCPKILSIKCRHNLRFRFHHQPSISTIQREHKNIMTYRTGRLNRVADLHLGGPGLDAALESVDTEKIKDMAVDAGIAIGTAIGASAYCSRYGHTWLGRVFGCQNGEPSTQYVNGDVISDPSRKDPRKDIKKPVRQVVAESIDILKDELVLNPGNNAIKRNLPHLAPGEIQLSSEEFYKHAIAQGAGQAKNGGLASLIPIGLLLALVSQ